MTSGLRWGNCSRKCLVTLICNPAMISFYPEVIMKGFPVLSFNNEMLKGNFHTHSQSSSLRVKCCNLQKFIPLVLSFWHESSFFFLSFISCWLFFFFLRPFSAPNFHIYLINFIVFLSDHKKMLKHAVAMIDLLWVFTYRNAFSFQF